MFTNQMSLGGGDNEAGTSNGHVSDIERKASPIVADGGSNDEHVEDIVDKWASSLARILECLPHHMCSPGHPSRISRIPENLREVDAKSYEPYFVSVGPYHHGKPKLQKIENRKRLVLKCFLDRKPEVTLKDYLKEIKSFEPVARSFYSDVEMESEEFVQMLLLDSLFILPLFCGMPGSQDRMNEENTRNGSRVDNEDTTERANQIDGGMGDGEDNENTQMMPRVDESRESKMPRWFWTVFAHDLFLLENQLPFFILQKMYILAYGGPETELIDIVKDKVGTMLSGYTKLDPEMVISPSEKIHHLLHLCHLFFCPTLQQDSLTCQLPKSRQMFRLGNALQLYEAGVSFEARSGSAHHSLLDITFGSSGKMVMPCLDVDDNTISLLRNLIALEQMKYPSLGLNVSAYVVLLLHLVTIPEDVGLLRRKGILQHHLASDKEMMHLVNRLSVGLAFDYVADKYSLKPVFQELKRYSERRVPRWRALLKHRYFNDPWTAISLLAASLLILSTLQTY